MRAGRHRYSLLPLRPTDVTLHSATPQSRRQPRAGGPKLKLYTLTQKPRSSKYTRYNYVQQRPANGDEGQHTHVYECAMLPPVLSAYHPARIARHSRLPAHQHLLSSMRVPHALSTGASRSRARCRRRTGSCTSRRCSDRRPFGSGWCRARAAGAPQRDRAAAR